MAQLRNTWRDMVAGSQNTRFLAPRSSFQAYSHALRPSIPFLFCLTNARLRFLPVVVRSVGFQEAAGFEEIAVCSGANLCKTWSIFELGEIVNDITSSPGGTR